MKSKHAGVITTICLIAAFFLFGATGAAGQTSQVAASATETITVPFDQGTAGVTTANSYSGRVLITVTGVGQAAAAQHSDAFYIYTDHGGRPVTPFHSTLPYNFVLWINGQHAESFLQSLPPYEPSHTYNFVIDAPGGQLTFCVGDSGTWDNAGSYTITIAPVTALPSTQTPTPTPAGWHDISLQQGVDGYAGTIDSWINGWDPNVNYGDSDLMDVRSSEWMHSLLRFELPDIPSDAYVIDAYLDLWCISRSNDTPIDIDVHELRRDWDEMGVNWTQTITGTQWQLPGAGGTDDYDAYIQDTVKVEETEATQSFRITEAVQRWINDPSSNHGLVLRSAGEQGVEYVFTTSEHLSVSARPRLRILYYWLPGSEPTATPTPTVTPGATGSPMPTSTPTATPVYPNSTELTLQQGMDGYAGVTDTWIDGWNPDTNYAADATLTLRSMEWMKPFIRFELPSDIPPDAFVEWAQLEFWVSPTGDPHTLDTQVREVLRAWDVDSATWNQAGAGVAWEIAGAKGTTDVDWRTLDTVEIDSASYWISYDVRSSVQKWIADPAINQGFVLFSDSLISTSYTFASSEAAQEPLRPRLRMRYSWADPTATPTPTATDTVAPTSTPTATETLLPTATATATNMPAALWLPMLVK